MKVKSIVIELEPEEIGEEKGHATRLTFESGCWSANGPVFNRLVIAQAEIWKILRGAK